MQRIHLLRKSTRPYRRDSKFFHRLSMHSKYRPAISVQNNFFFNQRYYRNKPEVEYMQLMTKFPFPGLVYDRIIETDTAAIIAASVTLTLIILLLVGIGISVKLYLDKVTVTLNL